MEYERLLPGHESNLEFEESVPIPAPQVLTHKLFKGGVPFKASTPTTVTTCSFAFLHQQLRAKNSRKLGQMQNRSRQLLYNFEIDGGAKSAWPTSGQLGKVINQNFMRGVRGKERSLTFKNEYINTVLAGGN